MSQALYRKYRSKSLADVVGQNHITDILSRALKSGHVAHAYLFTGPRGVGKTSIARILAHEINNLPYSEESNHLDIIEIDAASNNGVDDVRELREKVQLAPVSASKKVYIIDEVHMLTKQAFNALLKTLEEPPKHVVFILATTDIQKLPATIISRTQRYSFRAINTDDAVKHLRYIANQEKIKITDDALQLIAQRGDGSFRDSISLLDQLSSLTSNDAGITPELIELSLGLAPTTVVNNLLQAVEKHDIATIAKILIQTESEGISPTVLNEQIIQNLRNIAASKPQILPLLDALLEVPKSTQPAVKLLSVLGLASLEHKPRTAALATPVLQVSATVEELSKRPVKKQAKEISRQSEEISHKSEISSQSTEKSIKTGSPKNVEKTEETVAFKPKKAASSTVTPANFSWADVIEYARVNHLALFSVISKCEVELNGNNLTVYAVNPFYKKKLDDAKYSTYLYESVEAASGYQLTIHTIPTRAPIKNSQAAAIADIMGGGIEVSPEVV